MTQLATPPARLLDNHFLDGYRSLVGTRALPIEPPTPHSQPLILTPMESGSPLRFDISTFRHFDVSFPLCGEFSLPFVPPCLRAFLPSRPLRLCGESAPARMCRAPNHCDPQRIVKNISRLTSRQTTFC